VTQAELIELAARDVAQKMLADGASNIDHWDVDTNVEVFNSANEAGLGLTLDTDGFNEALRVMCRIADEAERLIADPRFRVDVIRTGYLDAMWAQLELAFPRRSKWIDGYTCEIGVTLSVEDRLHGTA
jgi:hypothetical protein